MQEPDTLSNDIITYAFIACKTNLHKNNIFLFFLLVSNKNLILSAAASDDVEEIPIKYRMYIRRGLSSFGPWSHL